MNFFVNGIVIIFKVHICDFFFFFHEIELQIHVQSSYYISNLICVGKLCFVKGLLGMVIIIFLSIVFLGSTYFAEIKNFLLKVL